MAKKKQGEIASVLAFEKKIVTSDGFMYSTQWDHRQQVHPVQVIEKSVRGTISNRLKSAKEKDSLKIDAAIENPNLQTVDAAALRHDDDTLKLTFSVKFLSHVQYPSACSNSDYYDKIIKMGNTYSEKYGFAELARRYALNLANGRFLWRNRVGAEAIEVVVSTKDKTWTFNAYDYSLRNFDTDDEKIQELAMNISEAFSGKSDYFYIDVEAYVKLGNGQEVYPSEELVFDKGRDSKNGKKSKVLYQVGGIGAMHSQKLNNALRTIDTWYPEFSTANIGPIAIEPYGAVTTLAKGFRTPKDKADFYTLFDAYSQGEALPTEEDEHYVMAVLIRGGVFGQSGKE